MKKGFWKMQLIGQSTSDSSGHTTKVVAQLSVRLTLPSSLSPSNQHAHALGIVYAQIAPSSWLSPCMQITSHTTTVGAGAYIAGQAGLNLIFLSLCLLQDEQTCLSLWQHGQKGNFPVASYNIPCSPRHHCSPVALLRIARNLFEQAIYSNSRGAFVLQYLVVPCTQQNSASSILGRSFACRHHHFAGYILAFQILSSLLV